MVITRDYGRLQALNTRLTANQLHTQQLNDDDEKNTTMPVNLTKNIYAIPKNL
jgi:hypothetical protein